MPEKTNRTPWRIKDTTHRRPLPPLRMDDCDSPRHYQALTAMRKDFLQMSLHEFRTKYAQASAVDVAKALGKEGFAAVIGGGFA